MAKDIRTYYEQTYIDNTKRLRELLKTLPPFVKDYFRAIEPSTSSLTRISYAYDLRVFFRFLIENNPQFKDRSPDQFVCGDLEKLEAADIEEYLDYLKVYDYANDPSGTRQVTNAERGIARKFSSVCSLYAYLTRHEYIVKNPTIFVEKPKLHEKAIIRLEADEVAMLLDYVENAGENLTGQRKVYYEKTKTRDLAIITLLLGTGIRVSECVGLDINDVDFKNNGITVTRKGGNQMTVYFGEEVRNALENYLETTRAATEALPGHERALFLSTQRKRIGVQAVENLVKKYAREVTPNKKITPHKLRSTYGTALYKETGDIYLVADVLGHKDVNTTRKHYADIDDSRRKMAAGAVRLREDAPRKE